MKRMSTPTKPLSSLLKRHRPCASLEKREALMRIHKARLVHSRHAMMASSSLSLPKVAERTTQFCCFFFHIRFLSFLKRIVEREKEIFIFNFSFFFFSFLGSHENTFAKSFPRERGRRSIEKFSKVLSVGKCFMRNDEWFLMGMENVRRKKENLLPGECRSCEPNRTIVYPKGNVVEQ